MLRGSPSRSSCRQRYLAGLTRTIVETYGRDKSDEWLDVKALDRYIAAYDAEIEAQERQARFLALSQPAILTPVRLPV